MPRISPAVVLAFAAGLAIGGGAGGWYGLKRGVGFILDECVYGDAKQAASMIGALKDLRAGKATDAAETIEARLDDQLVVFDPQEPYPLSERTRAEVDRTIQEAKAYRAAHPRKSSREFVDKMVAALFERR